MDEANECEASCTERRSTGWEGKVLMRNTRGEVAITVIGGKKNCGSACYDAQELRIGANSTCAASGSFDPASLQAAYGTEIAADELEMYKLRAIEKFTEALKGMSICPKGGSEDHSVADRRK